jgi:uncharacterized membrane-anchored protein
LWLVVAAATAILTNSSLQAQEAADLIPRVLPEKPVETRVTPTDNPHRVILKFREGSAVRLQEQRFVVKDDARSTAGFEIDLMQLEEVLR